MHPSKALSQKRLQNYVLPRRKIDEETEKFHEDNLPKEHFFYRKVAPDEPERGESFPVWNAGLKTFAHFGIGVGIYFFQLLMLGFVYFISGMIMITAVYRYNQEGYGVDAGQSILTISAACAPATNVTATINCPGGATECIATYRENCNLPSSAALADLFMSLLFMIFIYVGRFYEAKIEENLDEAIQTAQDYSLEVTDPNVDADDPDEWFEFFSKFGQVRYITILKTNEHLLKEIVEKYRLHRKSHELTEEIERAKTRPKAWWNCLFRSDLEILEKQHKELTANILISDAILKKELEHKTKVYPVCRVYVTFETEEGQRKCITELEVADIDAMYDRKESHSGKQAVRFRGINTLNVVEPPEPDNIIWANVEVSDERRRNLAMIVFVITLGLLVASFYIIIAATNESSVVLSIVIGFIDAILPNIFEVLTDITRPGSEGKRQSELQGKLFYARLLISTIFPYVQAKWDEVLTTAFIQQVINVQITACFTTTVLEIIDISGFINRHIVGPLKSESQAELNLYYSGKDWSLAAKYTGIAKILFLSLFYAILTPICLLIAMVAFLFLFLVDRYQLLRRWKQGCMLDASIAVRLRQQAILAAAAHMYVTLRFIYSWPMDQVKVIDSANQIYEYVDKFPHLNVFLYRHQSWHTLGQHFILRPYKAGLCVVAAITFWIWVLSPALKAYNRLFYRQVKIVGESQGKPFSDISTTKKMNIYIPIVVSGEEKFICSHNINVRPQHIPSLLKASKDDRSDVSDMVKEEDRHRVLSTVKYYGTDAESQLDDKMPEIVLPTAREEVPAITAAAPSPVEEKKAIIHPPVYAAKPEKKVTTSPPKQKRTVQNDYAALGKDSPMKLPPVIVAGQPLASPKDILSTLEESSKPKRNLVKRTGGDMFQSNKKVHPATQQEAKQDETTDQHTDVNTPVEEKNNGN